MFEDADTNRNGSIDLSEFTIAIRTPKWSKLERKVADTARRQLGGIRGVFDGMQQRIQALEEQLRLKDEELTMCKEQKEEAVAAMSELPFDFLVTPEKAAQEAEEELARQKQEAERSETQAQLAEMDGLVCGLQEEAKAKEEEMARCAAKAAGLHVQVQRAKDEADEMRAKHTQAEATVGALESKLSSAETALSEAQRERERAKAELAVAAQLQAGKDAEALRVAAKNVALEEAARNASEQLELSEMELEKARRDEQQLQEELAAARAMLAQKEVSEAEQKLLNDKLLKAQEAIAARTAEREAQAALELAVMQQLREGGESDAERAALEAQMQRLQRAHEAEQQSLSALDSVVKRTQQGELSACVDAIETGLALSLAVEQAQTDAQEQAKCAQAVEQALASAHAMHAEQCAAAVDKARAEAERELEARREELAKAMEAQIAAAATARAEEEAQTKQLHGEMLASLAAVGKDRMEQDLGGLRARLRELEGEVGTKNQAMRLLELKLETTERERDELSYQVRDLRRRFQSNLVYHSCSRDVSPRSPARSVTSVTSSRTSPNALSLVVQEDKRNRRGSCPAQIYADFDPRSRSSTSASDCLVSPSSTLSDLY
eukprot:TRINITY_DN10678_c0_g1_i2.p1 TRINITY_DN10678_c0_g1~~TRINITY_DN10678_c0_g1_i2.p1  ORF type:complete len:609 (-),score=218.07 TRINITY_DN10678_c0_g1_i2:165-1991(-)